MNNGHFRSFAPRLLLLLLAFVGRSYAADRPNVLFIAIDDLRPELGCYGSPIAVTPNLDRLAQEGLLFNRAYCQQAICAASRASLLTGLRPDTCGITHNYVKIRQLNPNVVTLPQYFGLQGYDTVYYGKVFHHGDDDPRSWNRQALADQLGAGRAPPVDHFLLAENQRFEATTRKEMFAKYGDVAKYGLAMGPAYECADVPDNAYVDGYNTDLAIATLQELAENKQKPFFLALGFNKPHLNWIAPKKYWDLYDRQQIPMSAQVAGPRDGAAMGVHSSFELRVRSGIPKTGEIDPELARTLKHAYLACVSYVDAQLGRMMRALDAAGVRDNTIIIVWGDNGFHLGEMGMWGKATDYEFATRVPLLLWTPGMPAGSRGKKTDALVELIDIFPSLCDLAGLRKPVQLEGTSFAPLLGNPGRPWKQAAFSQFPDPALREWGAYPMRPAMRETYFGPLLNAAEGRIQAQMGIMWDRDLFENHLTGYTMRTDRYRLVVWKDTKHPDTAPLDIELYDHESDPEESRNVAKQNPELIARLTRQLEAGWKASGPPPAVN